MKYKVIVEYKVEFNILPENPSMVIDDVLQIRDDEGYLRSLESVDWKATVMFIGKIIEVI